MYELSTVRPHEPDGRGFTRREWPVYSQGYYTALCMALQVMDLTAANFHARTRRRRSQAEPPAKESGAA